MFPSASPDCCLLPLPSHSIIFSHRNALISRRNFYARGEELTPNPSKIRALEIKGEFGRFRTCSVSASIDNDR
jgi:hypothetical protein